MNMMKPIQYRLISMEVVDFNCFVDNFDSTSMEKKIHNSFSFAVDVKNHVLLCSHQLALSQNDKTFLDAQVNSMFALSQESFDEMKCDNKITIPQGFLVQCASISYGSLRGVVLVKAKEFGLENIILPPAYMNQIIESSMIIEL